MNQTLSNLPSISLNQPTMLIDLKRNRIRIHRHTLHLLGEPEYIQFLINPEKNAIAIKSCAQNDYRSERIRWTTMGTHHSCEFYSKFLVNELKKISAQWQPGEKYHFYGKYLEKENLVLFYMNKYTLLDNEKSCEDTV